MPAGWFPIAGPGIELSLDKQISHTGSHSLRIVCPGSRTCAASGSVPRYDAPGRRVSVSGFIKTRDIQDGSAGFWIRADEDDGTMRLVNLDDRGATSTTDWARFSIDLDVPPNAKSLMFGPLVDGRGTAWFDSLELTIDGVRYSPPTFSPDSRQLSWLRSWSVPFDTADPAHGDSDLAGLDRVIGDAQIVGLGEGTHGTREFFQMKQRIVQYLVQRKGFTTFAIEASMPEAGKLNDYVINGNGDPRRLLAGMHFWTWDTQEFLGLIRWIRDYNASGKGPVAFTGFDCQFPDTAIADVESFLQSVDPSTNAAVTLQYRRVLEEQNLLRSGHVEDVPAAYLTWEEAATAAFQLILDNRTRYAAQSGEARIDWILQEARIVIQGAQLRLSERGLSRPTRDRLMADNLDWIHDHIRSGSRMIIWGHNTHIERAPGMMGRLLAGRYSTAYLPIGFAFGRGRYNAFGPRGLDIFTAQDPGPGSIEWALQLTGIPRLILDLRLSSTATDNESGTWLDQDLAFRSIGAVAAEQAFGPARIRREFDALIFFEQTHASTLLHDSLD